MKVLINYSAFCQGMGSVIDLAGFSAKSKMKKQLHACAALKIGSDGLRNDWNNVGLDYRTAFNRERKIVDNEEKIESFESSE